MAKIVKKVSFILPSLNSGGAERVAINFLRQLDLEKYQVTLIVLDKTRDLLSLLPNDITLIDLKTKSARQSFFALRAALLNLKPDVVFTTHSRIATLLMLVKPFVSRFKHVARMQSTPSLEKKHVVYGLIRRMLYAAGFKNADVVIAQTEAMKYDGIQLFGLDPAKVKVVSNPLDTGIILRSINDFSSPFPAQEISAVASGRLSYSKAFDVLIAALPAVVEKHPSFMLYILGSDNGEGEKLSTLVSNLGLARNVKFLGFHSNPYIYYAYCDVFILSSRWEGFPNVLLENYFLSTPIVATRCVPVVSELIHDGKNGYSCAVGDAEALSHAICKCLEIERAAIVNAPYVGGVIETIL